MGLLDSPDPIFEEHTDTPNRLTAIPDARKIGAREFNALRTFANEVKALVTDASKGNTALDGRATAVEGRSTDLENRSAGVVNVFEHIPSQYHAGIEIGSTSVSVRGWIQDALDETRDMVGSGGSPSLVFPAGKKFLLDAPLTLGGDGYPPRIVGHGRGTHIVGNFAGYLFDKANDSLIHEGPISLENLWLDNPHVAGGCIMLNGIVTGYIRGCRIDARGIGIASVANIFGLMIQDCRVQGSGNVGIGIQNVGHSTIANCDIVGWDEGIRATGAGLAVLGGRFEVNKTAMRLGVYPDGSNWILSRAFLGGMSFEANDTAIEVNQVRGLVLAGFGIHGTLNAPAGLSNYGIVVNTATATVIEGGMVEGDHAIAAIRLNGPQDGLTFRNVLAVNGHATAPVWDARSLVMVTFENCPDAPVVPEQPIVSGIAAIDRTGETVRAANVRGKDVLVPSAATYVDVEFPPALGSGHAAFASVTPTTGGTLAAGTYYYGPTIITELGETSALEATAAVVDGAVDFTFYGTPTTARCRRRVYRGTAAGVYDGYYDLPINSSDPWTDTGAAFDGTGVSPPATGTSPSGVEADASYGVTVTPQWNTTHWVTNKAATGFRVNFGTAPGSNSALDWHLVR